MARVKNLMGCGAPAAQAQATVGKVGTVTGVGTTQTGAALLAYDINNLVTAGGATAFILPSVAQGSTVGDSVSVFVTTATASAVFPDVGSAIDGNGANTSIGPTQLTGTTFIRVSATQWASTM